MEYQCPSCGAPIQFQSKVSVYTTCTHCGSNVVRHDMNLDLLGKKSQLLQDMSPFQVGTSGRFNGKGFTLLGRAKMLYTKGTWSEWYAAFDDGSEGWLAEAQGFYMMSIPTEDVPKLPSPEDLKLNQDVMIAGQKYVVDDLRKVMYAASEGELPYIFHEGEYAISADLYGPGGLFANISYTDEKTDVYTGKYQSFESFQFQNLRQIDGWTNY